MKLLFKSARNNPKTTYYLQLKNQAFYFSVKLFLVFLISVTKSLLFMAQNKLQKFEFFLKQIQILKKNCFLFSGYLGPPMLWPTSF